MLVSTVQQNESAIHIHVSPPFWTSFSFRSPVINYQFHFTNFLSGFFLKHHVFFCKKNGVTVWLKMKIKILKWGNQIWSFRLPLFHAFIPRLANYGWWLNSETTWLPMLKMFTLWCFPESLLSLAVNHGVICEAAVTPPISELQVLKGFVFFISAFLTTGSYAWRKKRHDIVPVTKSINSGHKQPRLKPRLCSSLFDREQLTSWYKYGFHL